jgi:acyl-coenzyme A synthetase/AMP-(fatty) acid ligase
VDTYWQTETGSHVITPLPFAFEQKPGETHSKKTPDCVCELSFGGNNNASVVKDLYRKGPGVSLNASGCASLPFFGVDPVIVDEKGNELEGACAGLLCMRSPWPSMMRTLWQDHERFQTAYFAAYPVGLPFHTCAPVL